MPIPSNYTGSTPYQQVVANAQPRPLIISRTATAPTSGSSPSTVTTSKLPKGILPIEFSYVNMGASLTNSQLYRVLGGSGGAQATQIGYVAPFKGSVVGMSLVSNAAVTAGTATMKVFKTGVVMTGCELVWTSGTSDTVTFPLSTYTFAENQLLDIRATTTGSYAPTTNDLEVFLYIAQDAS